MLEELLKDYDVTYDGDVKVFSQDTGDTVYIIKLHANGIVEVWHKSPYKDDATMVSKHKSVEDYFKYLQSQEV